MVSKNNNPNPPDQGDVFPKFPLKKGGAAVGGGVVFSNHSTNQESHDLEEGRSALVECKGKVPLKKGGAAGGGGVVYSYFPDEAFPSPEQLKNYESVLPGLAKRLVDQVEKQTVHRFEIENKLVSSGIRKSTLGLIFGFLIGSIGIGGGFYLTALGFNVIGIIFSSATLVSIVTAFIYGSQSKKNGIKKYPDSVS
jgi:uncharacterized membrane protein